MANAVQGVTEGFKRELDIVGVGYRAEVKGQAGRVSRSGYSHPVVFDIPAGIDCDHRQADPRDRHGRATASWSARWPRNIHGLRTPDPYKQKGVRYTGEVLKKKVGKTGA
jgi:large subunit ribosomal protein L6